MGWVQNGHQQKPTNAHAMPLAVERAHGLRQIWTSDRH
jgi:hypothetical protein